MFLDKKRDIGSSKLHSFRFPVDLYSREGNLSHKFSLHFWLFLLLLPPGWSGQACGFDRRKPWILRTVSYGEIFCSPPPDPPTRYPKMTPDPFVCLYQAVEVRNSDESLWLCVYTPESRKEGNQPRSAKSGEVRENSCSTPELQWFTSARQDLSHVISTAETFDQHKTATVTALFTGVEKKGNAEDRSSKNWCEIRRELNFLINISMSQLTYLPKAVITFSSFYFLSWCNPKANKSFCCCFSLTDFKEWSMQHSRALTKVKIFLSLL